MRTDIVTSPLLEQVRSDLHSLRDDVEAIRAKIEAQTYQDHLYAIDDMANAAAGMTRLERNYFDRRGKLAPAFLVRLADYWRGFRQTYGF